jgi:hypothetical protein
VLLGSGFTSAGPIAPAGSTQVEPAPLSEIDAWLDRFRQVWGQRLDALGTELARGKRHAYPCPAPGAHGDRPGPAPIQV